MKELRLLSIKSIIFITVLFICPTYQLTAQEVSNNCHCDLTVSYCDFGCCCDTDCSSTISEDCFLAKSSIFCINSSYYYKIDSSLKPSATNTGCYYYNSTTALQEEVAISSRQIGSIAYQNVNIVALSNNSPTMYKGYKIGDALSFSGLSSFNFVTDDGNCAGLFSNSLTINYRMDTDISCSGSTNNINLFNNILGQTVKSYSSASQTIQVPVPDTQSYNQILMVLFVARFGSSKTEYIQEIKIAPKSNANNGLRTLKIRFVDPLVDLEQEQSQPSFFPQIPSDIFYPVYQISYSY